MHRYAIGDVAIEKGGLKWIKNILCHFTHIVFITWIYFYYSFVSFYSFNGAVLTHKLCIPQHKYDSLNFVIITCDPSRMGVSSVH